MDDQEMARRVIARDTVDLRDHHIRELMRLMLPDVLRRLADHIEDYKP